MDVLATDARPKCLFSHIHKTMLVIIKVLMYQG